MSTRTAQFFDSYAPGFDEIYGNDHAWHQRLINKHLRKSMRLRFEASIATCSPIEGRSVLDIGCGPGHFGIALARKGAALIHGIDFAPSMIEIANQRAREASVSEVCEFFDADFDSYEFDRTYDYSIVMGFMDYMAAPDKTIEKVLSLTTKRAMFSFPAKGGVLAWQRQIRYKSRCDLYLYSEADLKRLFSGVPSRCLSIEKIARDYFVRVECDYKSA